MSKVFLLFFGIIFLFGCKDGVEKFDNVEVNNCHQNQPPKNEHDLPCKENEVFEGITVSEQERYGVCFTPSGCEGKICEKKSDCGRANCRFIEKDVLGNKKGVCADIIIGCKKWLNEEGEIEEFCHDI